MNAISPYNIPCSIRRLLHQGLVTVYKQLEYVRGHALCMEHMQFHDAHFVKAQLLVKELLLLPSLNVDVSHELIYRGTQLATDVERAYFNIKSDVRQHSQATRRSSIS